VQPDALHLLIKTAAVEQSGQRVGQRQPLHQLQLAAQPLDLLGTLLQVLVIDAGLDAHPGGLADQRLDHLMQSVRADLLAQPVAVACQLIPVVTHLFSGLDGDIIDMIDHARDLGAHARRGVDIAHRDVGIEQHLDVPVAQHRGLCQARVERGPQARVRAGEIFVPDAVTQGVKAGGVTRHQLQHHPQQLGGLFSCFFIPHCTRTPGSHAKVAHC
jgi:hypothetical protein